MGSRRALLLSLLLLAGVGACSDDGGDKIGVLGGVRIEVDPATLLFPATPVGETATRTVVVRHSGSDGTLHLGGVGLIDDSDEFEVSGPDVKLLAPGGSTRFTVSFSPVDDEPDVVRVGIEHDSPVEASPLVLEVGSAAPGQALVALPFELDFGDVVAGDEPELGVRFQNLGSRVVHVASVGLFRNSSPDFTLTTDAHDLGLPADVEPGEWLDVRVRYRPAGGDAIDTGLLQVVSTDVVLEASVDVRGRELAPDVRVSPAEVDFDEVFLHEAAEAALTVANVGDLPLALASITVVDARTPWIDVPDAPDGPLEVAPGEQVVVHVRFAPGAGFEATADALARVRIASNDPDQPFVHVAVRGTVRLPRVTAGPTPLDFGRVAPGDTRTRELLLLNNSRPRQDVTIVSAVLEDPTGEYALGPLPGFGPINVPAAPTVLPAGEALALPVSFTNQGGPAGEVVGGEVTLTYQVDDEPVARVELIAERAAGRACGPVLTPSSVDFGLVAQGAKRTRLLALRNQGSGTCRLADTALVPCEPHDATACQSIASAEAVFALDPASSLPGLVIPAGGSVPLPVTFRPPVLALEGDPVPFRALLSATLADLEAEGAALLTTPSTAPNLAGATGDACLVVSPEQVSFGDVRVGCASPLRSVHAHNTCSSPLQVTALALVGCDAEFRLVNVPYLPSTLTQENQMNLKLLAYAPVDLGLDGCALTVQTDEPGEPRYVLPLDGNGTLVSHVREGFAQTGSRAVDILFVVDNSGSMIDNQQNLAANFGSLAAIGEAWDTDVHLGVVTTDMTPWGGMGKLVGAPRYLTEDNWQLFADRAKVGADGSGLEQGLAAAEAALGWPLAADADLPCQVDQACTSPLTCVEGGCGGANRGFLRPEAVLHVVFVTDEDDQSQNSVAYYLDKLTGLKGPDHADLVQVHAVVGKPLVAGATSTCASQAGERYLELAAATGGVVSDICDTDWSAKLEQIGNAIFGLVEEFPLERTPDPETMQVLVNGKACADGWTLDAATNRLVFDPEGPCMPEHGDAIEVEYEVYCYRY